MISRLVCMMHSVKGINSCDCCDYGSNSVEYNHSRDNRLLASTPTRTHE